MKIFNLCLLGFGNVGRALARLLVEKTDEMREQFGVRWRVTGVATRRMGWLAAPEGLTEEELLSGEVVSRVRPQPSNVREGLTSARCAVPVETSSLEPPTGGPGTPHSSARRAR